MNTFTTQDCAWKDQRYVLNLLCCIQDTCLATHHGSAGYPVDRDINFYIEDTEATNLDHNNESTSGSTTTIALGGPEAEGHPDGPIHSNQA